MLLAYVSRRFELILSNYFLENIVKYYCCLQGCPPSRVAEYKIEARLYSFLETLLITLNGESLGSWVDEERS